MLGLGRINKKIFTKLHRYYWRKILRRWWMLAFYLVWGAIMGVMNFYLIGMIMGVYKNWQEILTGFFLLSGFQMFILYVITSHLANELVGVVVNFGFFQVPKKDNSDDLKVLVFTPGINRQTVILAKFTSVLAVFWGISFLLVTLPLFCYLLTFPNLSLPLNLLFLLLSGLVWAVQGFLLLVPSSFYFAENFSLITSLLSVFYLLFLVGSFLLFWFLTNYFIWAMFLYLPFSGLVGWFFWSLYCHQFLKKDIH